MAQGYEVTMAYPAPYKLFPKLSVRFHQWFFKSPSFQEEIGPYGERIIHMGVNGPELEFLKYRKHQLWKELIDEHDLICCVSGNTLPLNLVPKSRDVDFSWIATPYWEERRTHLVQQKGIVKIIRSLDALMCLLMEKRILSERSVTSLSRYTQKCLEKISPACSKEFIPMPIEFDLHQPELNKDKKIVIGFCGRTEDPRKNIDLFLNSLCELDKQGKDFDVLIIGGQIPKRLKDKENELKQRHIIFTQEFCQKELLIDLYKKMDILAISSIQEGLAIVGLEAMAFGSPVVSTKCGGPEDYITENQTGYLCDENARDMASKLSKLIENRELLNELKINSYNLIENSYHPEVIRKELTQKIGL